MKFERGKHNFQLSQIRNMETSMCFNLLGNRTINSKKRIEHTNKNNWPWKKNFTEVFSCLADGGKLPTANILNRKALLKNVLFLLGALVHSHKKRMNESDMVDWLKYVWNKRPCVLLKKHSHLVWDVFVAHCCV